MLVVDASVLVKIYIDEPGSDAAMLVLSETELVVPAHAFAEVGEVIARKVRSGQIDTAVIVRFVHAFRSNFTQVPLDSLIVGAIDVSVMSGASVYDCLYVAAAAERQCRVVTADERLIEKLKPTDFRRLLIPLNSYNARR